MNRVLFTLDNFKVVILSDETWPGQAEGLLTSNTCGHDAEDVPCNR